MRTLFVLLLALPLHVAAQRVQLLPVVVDTCPTDRGVFSPWSDCITVTMPKQRIMEVVITAGDTTSVLYWPTATKERMRVRVSTAFLVQRNPYCLAQRQVVQRFKPCK